MAPPVLLALAACAIFPAPRRMAAGSGREAVLGAGFSFADGVAGVGSERLLRAAERYDALMARHVRAGGGGGGGAPPVKVVVRSTDETLGMRTAYDYNITTGGASGAVEIAATSIYGAMYAMESLVQLVDGSNGVLPAVVVEDAPAHRWRGLLVDTGRRFFPVPLLHNLIDTMAAVKMNVLHLHIADHCRFSIESKVYPQLTAGLTGLQAGYYTQEDIAALVAYAGDRGVRVVPEVDIPGHARGYAPLEGADGVQFCITDPSHPAPIRDQLYNDPEGRTLAVLKNLFREMAALFPDEVFELGCDETAVKGRCDLNSTFQIEREMQRFVSEELGKTPAGWEELIFTADAAQQTSIIDAWKAHTAGEATALGHCAIESSEPHFYFTRPAPGGPAGWAPCWYNISASVPDAQRGLLLGGEISMWSDTYLYTKQCVYPEGKDVPVGAALYDPQHDAEFAQSIGGMIWPRGFVAAHAFWNFDSSDAASQAFADKVWALNDQLIARGAYACPSRCDCDQLTACGQPYLKAH